MRDWCIELNALGSVPLGTDLRLSRMSLAEDHIWALTSRNVQPSAVTFLTRFGLQARSYQIFPIFVKDETAIYQPQDFYSPPLLHSISTNYLQVSFSPWQNLQTTGTYWIPEKQVVAGQFLFENKSAEGLQFGFQLAGVLRPDERGQTMKAETREGRTVLTGNTGSLHPMLFLTGGAGEGIGSFPSLALDIDLPAQESVTLQWVSSTMNHPEDSFQLVQSIMERNWEAEFARIETLWNGQLQISTADPHWDLVFSLSQMIGFSSISHQEPDNGLTHFRDGRLDIDQPLSTISGFDSSPEDLGVTALQAFYLANLIHPTSPDVLESLVGSFLDSAREDGLVPFRSHPGREDRALLSSPFLIRLAWKAYEMNQDLSFLENIYPTLEGYLEAWFREDQDRDQDGAPEWSRVRQVECSAHPAHPSNEEWFLTPHIHYMESPALCALLITEIDRFLDISELLHKTVAMRKFTKRRKALLGFIHRSWDAETNQYRRWDRVSHRSPAGRMLQKRQGPGLMIIKKQITEPSRLVITLKSPHPLSPKTKIFLHGEGASKEHWVESISIHHIHWNGNRGTATSKYLYSYLEYIVSYGISPDVEVSVNIGDFQKDDILLLLPLASNIATQDQAEPLIERKVTAESAFWSQYGLKSALKPELSTVLPVWNALVGEGLLEYGKQDLAVGLFERLMGVIVNNMSRSKSFFTAYDARNGKGIGRPYRIAGAAPVGYFLHILGVQIRSNRELLVKWNNPFPWPVKLSYRGLEVIHEKEKTTVVFPDGQKTVIKDPHHKLVRLG